MYSKDKSLTLKHHGLDTVVSLIISNTAVQHTYLTYSSHVPQVLACTWSHLLRCSRSWRTLLILDLTQTRGSVHNPGSVLAAGGTLLGSCLNWTRS